MNKNIFSNEFLKKFNSLHIFKTKTCITAKSYDMLILAKDDDNNITLNISYLNYSKRKTMHYKEAIAKLCNNNSKLLSIYGMLKKLDNKKYATGIGNFNAKLHEYMTSINLQYYFSDGMVYTTIKL